jgi:transcription antitermination factor NusG
MLSDQEHTGLLEWFAIRVRSRYETRVAADLKLKGYDEFLPMYDCVRRWADRAKTVEQPLFPGYLFCRFRVRERLPILKTTNVITIAGSGKTPIAVGDDEIDALKSVIRSGLPAMPWEHVTVGSKVYIERGPLAGLEGIALNVEKKFRLIVSVPLLQRAVAVEIDRSWARPVKVSRMPKKKLVAEVARFSGERLAARVGAP